MPKFKVNKIYQYTEVVEVEAENKQKAIELAMSIGGELLQDDTLHDCEAHLIRE